MTLSPDEKIQLAIAAMLNALDFVDVDEFDQSWEGDDRADREIVNILGAAIDALQGTHTYVPLWVLGTDEEQNKEEAILWHERLTTMAIELGVMNDPTIDSEALSDLLVQTIRARRTDHA